MAEIESTVSPTTNSRRAPGILSAAELTEASRDLRRALVSDNVSDEHLTEYITTFAAFKRNAAKAHGMFRNLSAHNMALIEAQRAGRSLIGLYAGIRQWEKMERALLSDAKPLTIWVPSVRKVSAPVTQGKGKKKSSDDTTERLVRFSTAAVYDWSDTISTNPDFIEPEWETPLLAGDYTSLAALERVAPCPVEYRDLGGRPESGHTDGSVIVIDTGGGASPRPIGNLIATLAHELVHVEMGHPATLRSAKPVEREVLRAQIEAEAALGEFLLLKSLGLDESVGNEVTAAAVRYLRSWSEVDGSAKDGHKARMKLLSTRLESARVAVDTIVTRILVPEVALEEVSS